MKSIYVLIFVLSISYSCTTLRNSNSVNKLAEDAVTALKTDNYDYYMQKCLLSKKEFTKLLRGIEGMTPTERQKLLDNIDDEYESYLKQAKKYFDNFRSRANENINWSKIEFSQAALNKMSKDEIVSNIEVLIKYNGNNYALILDDCVYARGKWKLCDRVKWVGKQN